MEHTFVIIDNDLAKRNVIQSTMLGHDDFINVGTASTEKSALALILEENPALVFLNLEMPGEFTKEIVFNLHNELRSYLNKLPSFVVYASTEAYAIRAIRNEVIDYIVEPLDKHILRQTVLRYKKHQACQIVEKHFFNKTLCLKSYGDYKFINTDEVLYLKADNNTTDIIMTDGVVVNAFKTLKYFQKCLPDHFMRVHNSYIVNSHHISRIHFGKSQCTINNGKMAVPFSKSYRENVELLRDQLSHSSLIIA